MRPLACFSLTFLLLSPITACATWSRQPTPANDPPAYLQYQVWTPDSVLTLQKVRVERDTLHGIPITASRDCSGCAVSIPMSGVDSLRTGKTEHIGTAVLGLGAGAIAALILIVVSLSGMGSD